MLVNNYLDVECADSDIAIIGMSCRFPGDVNNPEEFWDFLLAGGDGIVEVPGDRWDNKAYYDADKNKKNKMYVNSGGFIKKIDQFDPLFFGVSPKEAAVIDPQHRWLLELTYEVFENAGLKTSNLKGSNTAVYIGQFMHDYEQLILDSMAHENITNHSATGPSMTLTSNRISYLFDFRGPSVTLDTACSSSLVALDFACKALLNGDSDMAIAGGVNILLRPELTMSICKASMLSPDCRCKSFDASANGYVRSEGAGIVLIKKLSDALRDGNNVLAIIKATGVNQDGQTIGITVPSGAAQKKLLINTLARASVLPEDIQYAEAHGTGTAVGDPIEVNALGGVLGERAENKSACIIGSVKSNIGHTEAAAGMAGLIKTVLAMNNGVIPKNIHYNTVNPSIDLKNLNIQIANENTPWPESESGVRHAIVNSFGFGGTNANVVLQLPLAVNQQKVFVQPVINNAFKLIPISSKTDAGLKDQAIKYKKYFSTKNDVAIHGISDLHDICYTASTMRDHHKHRLVVCGTNQADIESALNNFISGVPSIDYISGLEKNNLDRKMCFVFSGMGAQWAGMGKSLYQSEPVFKAEMDRCNTALFAYTQWSLVDALFRDDDLEKIHDTNIAQPGIFAIQVALAALLKSWGVVPEVVVGHSAGEVGAAYVAGALSFDDAIKVVYYRSQLQHTTEGMGKMLAVGLSETALQPYLKEFTGKISIGAINSDDAITLSGDASGLKDIAERLEGQDIFARFLNVGVPYHSPVMDRLKVPLIDALKDICVQVPHTTLFSTVSGKITKENDWNAEYWADNVREPVRFQDAIENILKVGINVFIEIAPHGVLSSSIQKNLQKNRIDGVCVTTLKRGCDDTLMLMQSLGALHAQGFPVDWNALYPQGGQLVSLPHYAWQHASYWAETDIVQESRLKNIARRDGFSDQLHNLLGREFNSLSHLWQQVIDLNELNYLAGHQVENDIVYPGAAYIEMGLAVSHQLFKHESVRLTNVEFNKALFLNSEKPSIIETTYNKESGVFVINAVDPQTDQWSSYSQGGIEGSLIAKNENKLSIDNLKHKFNLYLNKEKFYEHCHKLGLTYVDYFQIVENSWYADFESLVEIVVPESLRESLSNYMLHPVILDGAFQSLFPTISSGYLPTKIASLNYYKKPDSHVYAYLNIHIKNADSILGDVTILSLDGDVLVEAIGIELKSTKSQQSADSILYDLMWEPQPFQEKDSMTGTSQWIVFVDNSGVGEQLVSELRYRGQFVCVIEKGSYFEQISEHHYCVNHESLDDISTVFKLYQKSSVGIIYLWGVENKLTDDMSADIVMSNCLRNTLAPVLIVQAMDMIEWKQSQKIFFITQGVQQIATLELPESSQATLWGFARVLASEHPEYAISLVDLAVSVDDDLISQLAHQITHNQYEQEVAFKSGIRYVNRLRQLTTESLHTYAEYTKPITLNDVYTVNKNTSQQLKVVAARHVSPADNDVVVKVSMSYLSRANFNQLVPLNGVTEENSKARLSYIAVGKIIEKGIAVKSVNIGENVIAFVQQSESSSSEITLSSDHILSCNNIENDNVVMALGSYFLTAFYALNQVIQIGSKSHVLIHNATEGVGLAALHLAKIKHAIIYATADTLEKRRQLEVLGVDCVFDLNSHSVNTGILSASGHGGIDLVINACHDTNIYNTVSVVKPFGCWIDVCPSGMQSPNLINQISKNNISYHSVNIDDLLAHRTELCISIFNDLTAMIDTKKITIDMLSNGASPIISVSNLNDIANHLTDGDRSGITLNFDNSIDKVSSGFLMEPVNGFSSYLVTGGLGGLGLEIMDWLVSQGAISIVLMGRSAPSHKALHRINAARQLGIKVEIIHADVTCADDVENTISTIQKNMLPLAGIIHSAGVLDDGIITQQTSEKIAKVFSAKITGAWNLHKLSQSLQLDFFVCFSSIASIVGWAGQSNYAAANAFMDSLAYRRHAQGKPALTINWGPWSGSGMAANLDERDIQRMNNAGMMALKPEQGLSEMFNLLKYSVPHAGVFDLDWQKIIKVYQNPARKTLFKYFIDDEDNKKSTSFIDQLFASPVDKYEELLSVRITEILADVLGIESLDAIDKAKNVFEYGMNSLMSMDFKNRLQAELKLKLPATLVMKYPTVNAITEQIVGMLKLQEEVVY